MLAKKEELKQHAYKLQKDQLVGKRELANLEKLRDEKTELLKKHKDVLADLQQKIGEQGKIFHAKRVEFDEARVKGQEAEAKFQAMERREEELKEELRAAEEDAAGFPAKIDECHKEESRLQNMIAEAITRQIPGRKAEKEFAEASKNTMLQRLKKKEAEVAEETEEFKIELREAEQKLVPLDADKSATDAEIQTAQTQLDQITRRVDEARRAQAELDQKIAEVSSQKNLKMIEIKRWEKSLQDTSELLVKVDHQDLPRLEAELQAKNEDLTS